MRRALTIAIGVLTVSTLALAQESIGPYRVLRTVRAGGEGGFDYVYADAVGRRLYVPRNGQLGRMTVFDLDTLASVGEIPKVNARGAAIDPTSGHGFSSSRPIAMWDAATNAVIKTLDVAGNPDGILLDPFNQRVWIFSHTAPNATIINATDGAIVGTLDLGGAPEQAVSDGNGRLYVDLEDQDSVAVVDTRSLKVTGTFSVAEKARTPAGLALDAKNHVLFAACRNPGTMVMLNADTGAIIASLPIGAGVDGAVFNPATMEVFSSQGDGTLTVIKEKSSTSFEVEQTVKTMTSAKTLTLDAKTNHIIVIAAEYGSPTPAPPGGRAGRGQLVADSFSILVVGR
jgi:DNA-binding beta-propeller fold protein YncE